MHELRLAGPAGAELDVRAARLKRLGVAAGRNLAIRLLARQPHLDVVRLRRRESHVAGAEQHRAIRQLEPLQHFLRVRRQRLELLVGLLRRRQLHELDLVELMLADQAAHVLAVRAGFAAEARRVGRVADRQLAAVENLAAMQVGQRHLGGRHEIQIPVAGNLEQIRLELRQVAGADERRALTRNGGSISR